MSKLKEVTKRLEYYNEWRRGGDGEQPNPTQLGKDIEYAIDKLKQIDQQKDYEFKNNHNPPNNLAM